MTDQIKYGQKLAGKKALIVGGSAGIGFGVAEALIESGAHVVISSSSQARVDKAIGEIQKAYPKSGKNISGYAYDMGTQDTLEKNVFELLEKCGQLDHIIWTAGDALATIPISELTLDQAIKAGMVRYFGPLLIGKYGPKYLKKSPESSITFTTGSVSQKPIPGWAAVNGFATALHGLTRGFALDLKPIRVNLISPGAVETELWAGMPPETRQARFKSFEEHSLTGKMGQVVDVAESYLYLIKDRNVTGTVISTNSGALLL